MDPYKPIKDNLKIILESLKENNILLPNVNVETTIANYGANVLITLSLNEITPATPTKLECRSGIITEF